MPVAFPQPRDETEAEGMQVLKAAVEDRDKWMEEVMKKHVPERINRLAHYNTKRSQIIVKRWLDRHRFEFREKGTQIQLAVRGKVIASHDFNTTTLEGQ